MARRKLIGSSPGYPVVPERSLPSPRGDGTDRPSQVVTGAGTRLGEPLRVLLRFPLAHDFAHGAVEVIAEVLPEFLAHLLHEAAHSGRIVLVEVAGVRRIAQRIEALVLRLDPRESRPHPGQRDATALGTGGSRRRGRPQDEQAHAPATVVTFVLVDRHGGTDLTMRLLPVRGRPRAEPGGSSP